MDREQYQDAYSGTLEENPAEAVPVPQPVEAPAEGTVAAEGWDQADEENDLPPVPENGASAEGDAVPAAPSAFAQSFTGGRVPPPYGAPYPPAGVPTAAQAAVLRVQAPQNNRGEKDTGRRRFFIFGAVTLAVCLLCSIVAGAGSSFFVLKLYSARQAREQTTEENTYVPDLPTAELPAVDAPAVDETAAASAVETTAAVTGAGGDTVTLPAAAAGTGGEKRGKTKGEIYAAAVNSIVSVEAKGTKTVQSMFGFMTGQPVTSRGSGFFYSADGYIVTNYHVIEGMESYSVTTYEGEKYEVRLQGYDAANDIAVLKAEGSFTPVTLGASASLQVGDDVLVIGNALGELSYTFTDGVVSYLNRTITGENGRAIRMFQTNAAINEGNSGGPVFNMEGEVVGIASAKYASETIEGLGFCIPIDDVKSKLRDIVSNGYVTDNPKLGVSVQTVSSGMSLRYNLPVGCYIVICEAGSAADAAGLAEGDVLIRADGYTLSSCADLGTVLSAKKAGQTMELTFVRGGAEQTVTLTLGVSQNAAPRTSYSNVFDY